MYDDYNLGEKKKKICKTWSLASNAYDQQQGLRKHKKQDTVNARPNIMSFMYFISPKMLSCGASILSDILPSTKKELT